MTTLYRPVLIESAEQAEALPTGAILHRTRGSWPTGLVGMVLRSPYTDRPYYRVGVDHWPVRRVVDTFAEALVPIEADEEAEESPSVDYEAMWWGAERRAEKTEAERDRWHSMWRQRGVKHLAAEKRATRAEARIKAVEDVLTTVEDGHSADPVIRGMFPRMVNTDLIRRALDGDA